MPLERISAASCIAIQVKPCVQPGDADGRSFEPPSRVYIVTPLRKYIGRRKITIMLNRRVAKDVTQQQRFAPLIGPQ